MMMRMLAGDLDVDCQYRGALDSEFDNDQREMWLRRRSGTR